MLATGNETNVREQQKEKKECHRNNCLPLVDLPLMSQQCSQFIRCVLYRAVDGRNFFFFTTPAPHAAVVLRTTPLKWI